jgi:RmuC family
MVQSFDSERLVDALSREVGLLEEKVANLEEKCSEIRNCIAAVSETLRQSRSFFSRPGGGASTSRRPEEKREGLSPAVIAELCGMKDHIELIPPVDEPGSLANLVVHEPGERTIIFVDGQLSGCRLEGARLIEAARSRLQQLAAMPSDGSDLVRVLYVPEDAAGCCGGYEELLEEAERRRVTVASPAHLLSILGSVALRWLTFTCGQNARAVVDRGQDLVDVVSAFISDFTETEKLLCELVNDCALASRRREQAGASLHA